MSGIAALAAAAAATSKITTSGAQTITTTGGQAIKVIQQGPQGQLITPQGVKVTPMVGASGVQPGSGTALIGGQTVRLASPSGGLLKTASGATITTQSIGGKQIILQKQGGALGGAGGQPQIVTLVKTPQGMQVYTAL